MKSKHTPYFTTTRTAVMLAATVVLAAPSAMATVGTWNSNFSDNNWSDTTQWVGGIIPNGTGDTANLTYNLSNAIIVRLTGDTTVGNLNFGDPTTAFNAYSVSANASVVVQPRLIFDQTGVANATLTIPTVAGVAANTISVNVGLKDNLVITTGFANSATTQLNISGVINDDAGTFGLVKEGPGIIQLGATNLFDGGVTVNGGKIIVNNLSALGTGPVTVASGGQVQINNNSSYNNFTIAGTGYANSADTAVLGQAGAIRFVNMKSLIGNLTVGASARIGCATTDSGYIMGNLLGTGDLDVNGASGTNAATTSTINLLGNATGYSGTLSVTRGNFNFAADFGGSIAMAPVSGATTTLGTGTSLVGNLSLDSSNAAVTVRNLNGTLAITGNLTLTGNSPLSPVVFPAPGTGTLTLMSYATKTGTGNLTFDATGFRGTPALTVGATSAVISGINGQTRTWSNAAANGTWNVNSSANWAEGDLKFCHADAVVFGNTAAGTVTLTGTLRPQSVTFTNTGTNAYVLSGSGVIDGAGGGIIKNGSGSVTLGGANTFTGPVAVNLGRLLLGTQQALGFTSGVTVASGATLDVNGQALNAVSRVFDVSIAGTGDGTGPALTNSGATIAFAAAPKSGIRNVKLTADATVGCDTSKVFDIGGNGVIDGGGFTLTKVGLGQVYLLGISKNLNTVVSEGTLTAYNTDGFGTNLRIKNGAVAQCATLGVYTSNVTIESGGKLELVTGAEDLWTGTFSALGDVILSNTNTISANLVIGQGFSIPGNLTKSGNGSATLLGNVAVAGTVNINGGTGALLLGNGGVGGSVGTVAPIVMTGTSLIFNRSDDCTVPNLISGTGTITKMGAGAVTLQANNSYSVATNVTAGTLIVDGIQTGTGAVTVSDGATLGGSGTMPGATTAAYGSTVAPGDPIGTLTLGSSGKTTTINGTLRVQYNGAASPAIDTLVANGPLTLGTLSTLDFAAAGSSLAGPAYVIASYVTLTGTFGTVTNLPPGYQLVYNYNNGVNSNNIALVQLPPYQFWISQFYPGVSDPTIIGPGADPDHDGISNMLESQLGTNPSVSSPGLVAVSATGNSLTLRHSRADVPVPGVTLTYQWSTDLASWNDSGTTAGGVTVTITPSVLTDNPSPANDVIQVVATVTGGSASGLFVRIKTTTP